MGPSIQLVIDAADPGRLAQFWALALGYVVQPPPQGFDSWEDLARDHGIPEEHWNDQCTIIDPDDDRQQIFLQRVPQAEQGENRAASRRRRGQSPSKRRPKQHTSSMASIVEPLQQAGTSTVDQRKASFRRALGRDAGPRGATSSASGQNRPRSPESGEARVRQPAREPGLGAASLGSSKPGRSSGPEVIVARAQPQCDPSAVGARVRAEEPHVRAHPAQPHQRLANPRLGDVSLAVDREAVATDPVAGGARLDPGQVDPSDRELVQDLQQCPRVVVPDERDERCLVRARRPRRRSGP